MAILSTLRDVFIALFGSHRGPKKGSTARLLLLMRYTFASMVLGTVPLVVAPQGRDLLVALADHGGHVSPRVFFYSTLVLWALSVWYWSRVVLDAELQTIDAPYQGFARRLPRILGTTTLLLPAIPLARADNDFWVKAAMIAGCVVLAGLFHFFVSRRRDWMPFDSHYAVGGFSLAEVQGRPAFYVALVSGALSVCFFGLFVLAPLRSGEWLGAVGILFVTAAAIVFLGNLSVFASQATGVRLDLVALSCAAVFSYFNDNHDVTAHRLPELPSLEQQFDAWRAKGGSSAATPIVLVAAEGGGIRAAYWTATVLGELSEGPAAIAAGRMFAVSGVSGGTLGATVYAALRADAPQGGTGITAKAQKVLSHDFLSPTVAKLVSGDFLQWFLPVPIHAFDRSSAMEDAFADAYRLEVGKDTLRKAITALTPDAAAGVPALVMNTTVVDGGGRAIIAPFTWNRAQLPATIMYSCWITTKCRDVSSLAAPDLAASVHNSARFPYISPAGLVRSIGPGPEPESEHRGARLGHVVDAGYFDATGLDTLIDLAAALRAHNPNRAIISIYITNQTVPDDVNNAALKNATTGENDGRAAADPDEIKTANVPNDVGPAAPVFLLGEIFSPIQALLRTRAAHGQLAVERTRALGPMITFGFCPLEKSGNSWLPRPRRDQNTKKEEEQANPPLGWMLSQPMRERLNTYWSCDVNKTGVDVLKRLLDKAHTTVDQVSPGGVPLAATRRP